MHAQGQAGIVDLAVITNNHLTDTTRPRPRQDRDIPTHAQLNAFPLDRSLAAINQRKQTLLLAKDPNGDYDFYKYAAERGLLSTPNAPTARLKTANLYTKYDVVLDPKIPIDQLSRWVSQTGVLSLIERGKVPRTQNDLGPALKGTKHKNYLRAIKSRVFPMELKSDLGSIWEQPRRVYLPALRLDPALAPPVAASPFTAEMHYKYQALLESEMSSMPDLSSTDSVILYQDENSVLRESVKTVNPEWSTGWVIYIQNGRLIESNPSFISFYSSITEKNLQPVAGFLLESILKIAVMYSIPLVTIKCQAVINSCYTPLLYPIPTEKLISCIYNNDEVKEFMSKRTRLYLNGDIGLNIAARTIQYYHYRYRTRVQRKQEELNYRAKKLIKAFFTRYKAKKAFQKISRERMIKGMAIFQNIQENYLRDGGNMFIKSRALIYICPPEKYEEPFNHLERAFSLSLDPEVMIILVLHNPPYNIKEQVARVIDLGHQGDPIVKGRLHIVVTEVSPHLPKNAQTGSALILSVKALNKVKELCKKRYPLIIADNMTNYIATLCHEINCPFYGPTLKVSQAIENNPLEIHSWIVQSKLPVMPAFEMSRSHKDSQIIEKAQDITNMAPDIKRWIFRRYDRFGNKHITFDYVERLGIDPRRNRITTLETSRLFWVFGGLLEAIPSVERYKLIQVGVQLDPNGNWQVLAATETNIVDLKETGMIIPQQSIDPNVLTDLLSKLTVCFKEHFYIGYFTALFYCWEDAQSKSMCFKISSVVPYINRAVLHSVAFATKSRLILNPDTYTLHLQSDKTPWEPPFLTPNSNQQRWNEQFKGKLPPSAKRIIFSTETIKHDLFQHLKSTVCSISLQRRGITYDNWAVTGIEFPYSETRFPIICVGQTLEQVYEHYLMLLTKIEEMALESEFLFSNNLHWVAFNALHYLQVERKKNGSALMEKEIFPFEFENAYKTVHKLLQPFLKNKWTVNEPVEIQKSAVVSRKIGTSAETLKILAQDIPSIVAFAKDPSLKNPSLATKGKKPLKIAEERAAALIEILENPRIPKSKKMETPWSKLK